MMHSYLSLDGARAAAVLILALGQVVMAYWPEFRRWPDTIATRSAHQSTPVVPVGWAFAVWGLIFFACAAFAIWHALPNNLGDPLLRVIGWLAVAVFTINIAWEYHVPLRDIDWTSVVLILLALVALLAILYLLERAEPLDTTERWLVAAPFQLFAGWISAATFVNLSSTLRLYGIMIGRTESIGLICAAVVLGSLVAMLTGSIVYALVIAWALFGIVVANRSAGGDRPVAIVAAALLPVVPLVSMLNAG
jgi:hypothetical protein